MLRIGGAVALLLLVAACGGGSEEPDAKPMPSASPTKAVPVSLNTTCDLLFNINKAPVPRAIDWVPKDSFGTKDIAIAKDIREDFEDALSRAPEDVRPFIEQQIAAVKEVQSMLDAGEGVTRDMTDFRASGLELVNQCEEFID